MPLWTTARSHPCTYTSWRNHTGKRADYQKTLRRNRWRITRGAGRRRGYARAPLHLPCPRACYRLLTGLATCIKARHSRQSWHSRTSTVSRLTFSAPKRASLTRSRAAIPAESTQATRCPLHRGHCTRAHSEQGFGLSIRNARSVESAWWIRARSFTPAASTLPSRLFHAFDSTSAPVHLPFPSSK